MIQVLLLSKQHRDSLGGVGSANEDLSKLSLFQGVDVSIEGVQVDQIYFDKDDSNGIQKYNGKWEWEVNRIRLDPDLPNHGLPDFISHVSPVSPMFGEKGFFDQLFGDRYSLPESLKSSLRKFRVVDSFKWLNGDNYIEIQHHIMQFYIDVGTQYNTKNDFSYDLPSDVKMDVLGNKFNKKREWDRQRYPNIQVLIKFNPQSPEYGSINNPDKPKFAVAAVEVIGLNYPKLDNEDDFYASRRSDGGYGADEDIKIGRLIPLFDKVEDIPSITSKYDSSSGSSNNSHMELSEALFPFQELKGKSKDEIVNRKIFGNEKYSVISIANIGTWREGNAFLGKDVYAEAVRFKFALHLFVYGNWNAKFEPVSTWEAVKAQSHSQKSFVDRALSGIWNGLIPSLNLGDFGRVLFIVILIIILSPFIPAVMQIIRFFAFMVKKILSLLPGAAS